MSLLPKFFSHSHEYSIPYSDWLFHMEEVLTKFLLNKKMAAYFHNIIFVLSPLVTTEWHILYSWRIFIEMRNLNGLAHGL